MPIYWNKFAFELRCPSRWLLLPCITASKTDYNKLLASQNKIS